MKHARYSVLDFPRCAVTRPIVIIGISAFGRKRLMVLPMRNHEKDDSLHLHRLLPHAPRAARS